MLRRWAFLLTLLFALLFVAGSARLLEVDDPQKSDVIVVLAGETDRRPQRGLGLLAAGYAPAMFLDAPVARIYDKYVSDIAENYLRSAAGPRKAEVCPVYGLSTKAEVEDVKKCLLETGARTVLLVTSDYHTRRALSIFHHQDPSRQYSIAAAYDDREFGVEWWRHREWAKTNVAEWTRLIWWELVDRWH
jgi:uncharacterized SAM-binding protein YcdF (DUF218 family)